MTINVNSTDVTSQIEQGSVRVVQRITHQRDSASFRVKKAGNKTLIPAYNDTITIYDGATKIFGGRILSVELEPLSRAGGQYYKVSCVDHIYDLDKVLASVTYENKTISFIVNDLLTQYAASFTSTGVTSTYTIEKIVFNQVPLSTCIKRLADVLSYDWDVDVDKDVKIFAKYANTAPFYCDDSEGNYILGTLRRIQDGSEVVNRVKIRGAEYNGAVFTDVITVSGNDTKSFNLPYRFANLTVEVDTGGGYVSKNVGILNIDDFTSDDVLYDINTQSIQFENALSDGDKVRFSGNRKVGVFAISEDPISIAEYGVVEKFEEDKSLESNALARRRANAELYTYSEPIIDFKFQTYRSGLEAGMLLSVDSDLHNISDELIIKQVTFIPRDESDFKYEISLVSTRRYDFITMLQKILESEPKVSDEQEASEQIFADTQNITISEEYEVVSAQEDHQTITVSENYQIDPLGDETDAAYVFSPYTPTGQTDTKRPGRFNVSLTFY